MSKPQLRLIEEATFEYLRALSELTIPRELEPCVKGVVWAIRHTLGKELKRLGMPLRFPEAIQRRPEVRPP